MCRFFHIKNGIFTEFSIEKMEYLQVFPYKKWNIYGIFHRKNQYQQAPLRTNSLVTCEQGTGALGK